MSLILDWYSLVVQPTPDGDNVGWQGGGHHGQQHGVGSSAGHHGGGDAELLESNSRGAKGAQ